MFGEPYLAACSANFVPLTPLSFLRRALEIHSDQPAIVWRDLRWNYREFGNLVFRMASWLKKQGVRPGDVVSVILNNRPEMLAAHFAVPGIGAVLNTVNTRLNAAEISYILEHAGSRLMIADGTTVGQLSDSSIPVFRLCDAPGDGTGLDFFYGQFDEQDTRLEVREETGPISLNYTSGTTGNPKGVVYTHRGAYLNALGNVIAAGFTSQTRYLWTLPMFHCNGWTHTWAVTAAGGVHVCLDKVDPQLIVDTIAREQVTDMSCAPVVLYMLLDHMKEPAPGRVRVGTGGAAPTPTLLSGLEKLGFNLVHLYGLTETYGPVTMNDPIFDPDFALAERSKILARQGFRHETTGQVRVVDELGTDVPCDGVTIGEVAVRGNTLMAGYFRDPDATEAALKDGYFRTGDLAVVHPDRALEIQDRAKDIIISGGENFSSLEVETILHQHPDILIAAVVAAPDPKWGETAWAFVEAKNGRTPDPKSLEEFCRSRLAGFKRPRKFVFGTLPKTATGKIQKFALRDRVKEMASE